MRHFTLYLLFYFILLNSLSAQWESLGSGTNTTPRLYFALDVVDADIIWAITIHPSAPVATHEVIKSTDGGETWAVLDLPSLAETYYTLDVQAIDENIAWVLLVNLPNQDKAKIFKTVDGGLSWTEQMGEFNDAGHAFASIHFFNENEGLCFGSPGTGNPTIDSLQIFKTIDSGTTWDRIPISELPDVLPGEGNWLYSGNGAYEVKGDTLWFVTRRSRVFRTIDKGANWEAFETGIHAGQGLSAIAFENELNGIVVGAQPNRAARTTDGGVTWTTVPIPFSPVAGLIEYIPGTEDTYVISPGAFFGGLKLGISRDAGMSWATPSYPERVRCLEFISPTLGFAGGPVSTSLNEGLFKWTGDLSDPLYVNHAATGANDGTRWEDAFTSLQSALDVAGSSSQIWVAQGVYKPNSPSMHPDSTLFEDVVGVKLYGGFEGTENIIEQRDTEAYPSILSGDLLGDDIPNNFVDNRDDNVRHVLSIIHFNESVLDGFTISGGNGLIGAVFGELDYLGGGLQAFADIDVNNCIFIHNQAAQGAGMVWQNNKFSLTNCSFIQNNSTFGTMLAVSGIGEPSLIEGNRFEDNTASDFGGALTIGNMSAIVSGNVFENNSTLGNGGAIIVFQNESGEGGKSVGLFNNDFINNRATFGGALTFNNFNHATSLQISDCLFDGNTASITGGGATLNNFEGQSGTIDYTASFLLERNTFSGNTAEIGGGLNVFNGADSLTVSIFSSVFDNNIATINGGGVNIEKGELNNVQLLLDDLTITGNNATEKGGGLYLDIALPGQLLNSVITENNAAGGAALYLHKSSKMHVENVLVTNNTGAAAIENRDTLNLIGVSCIDNDAGFYQEGNAVTYFQNTILSNIENNLGASGQLISKGGNLSSDATFSSVFTTTGDFQDFNETDAELDENFIPISSSPCIDAGNPADVTQDEDLEGNLRIKGAQIDIGAFETPFTTATNDLNSSINITAFPNPFIDEIHITGDVHILSLKLMDVTGRLLFEVQNRASLKGLKSLPTAIYLLKIEMEEGTKIIEVIKS